MSNAIATAEARANMAQRDLAVARAYEQARTMDADKFRAQLAELQGEANGKREYYESVIQNAIMLALREYVEGGSKNPTFVTEVWQTVKGMYGFSERKVAGYVEHVAPTLEWNKDNKKFQNRERGVTPEVCVDKLLVTKWSDHRVTSLPKQFDLQKEAAKLVKACKSEAELNEILAAVRQQYLLAK